MRLGETRFTRVILRHNSNHVLCVNAALPSGNQSLPSGVRGGLHNENTWLLLKDIVRATFKTALDPAQREVGHNREG